MVKICLFFNYNFFSQFPKRFYLLQAKDLFEYRSLMHYINELKKLDRIVVMIKMLKAEKGHIFLSPLYASSAQERPPKRSIKIGRLYRTKCVGC